MNCLLVFYSWNAALCRNAGVVVEGWYYRFKDVNDTFIVCKIMILF